MVFEVGLKGHAFASFPWYFEIAEKRTQSLEFIFFSFAFRNKMAANPLKSLLVNYGGFAAPP